MNKNKYQQMSKESEQFASIYRESQEILADRYEQEMNKATHNIKEEVDKAESPYLGESDLIITTIDL